MRTGETLRIAAFALALAGLVIPAFAQEQDQSPRMPEQGMRMGQMGQGMMGGGMMGGMMSDGMRHGCSEMMRSMNNGRDGRPNSQWQAHPSGSSSTNGK